MELPEALKNFIDAINWQELDINEKQGLFDALNASYPIDLGLFEMVQANGSDENLVLYHKGVNPHPQLFLTPAMRAYFKSCLETEFTEDNDGWSYLELKKQIEKED